MDVWRWPVVLGVLSAAGLVAALVGDGWWDVASTCALGVVTLVCVWIWLLPGSNSTRSPSRLSRRCFLA